jgi:hypothetical protein
LDVLSSVKSGINRPNSGADHRHRGAQASQDDGDQRIDLPDPFGPMRRCSLPPAISSESISKTRLSPLETAMPARVFFFQMMRAGL